MWIPKSNTVEIYEQIFKDGVMVAKKDTFAKKHMYLPKHIPNLHVMKTMQSLLSRNYVTECAAWRHLYYSLTNEGILYIRDYLRLPAEIVPATLKKPTRMEGRRPVQRPQGRGTGSAGSRDADSRGAYRRAPDSVPDKTGDAGIGSASMEFRGGFGRGRGRGSPPQKDSVPW